jgi:hypothetical protein
MITLIETSIFYRKIKSYIPLYTCNNTILALKLKIMLKGISNLGTVLNKSDQKIINE